MARTDPGRRPAARREGGALLLLPGTACDDRVFYPVRDSLGSRAAHVPLPDRDRVEAMAAAVLDRAPDRFAVAGLSLGGIVALHVALLAPERVTGLALIAANARAVPADRHAARRREARAAVSDLRGYAATTLAPLYAGRTAAGDPAFAPLVAAMAAATGAAAFGRQTEAALTRPDLRARLGRIAAPTCVIGGEEDRLGTPAMQRELAGGIAGATLALLPATGHLVPLEAPGATAALLNAWLARVDAGTGATYRMEGEERA